MRAARKPRAAKRDRAASLRRGRRTPHNDNNRAEAAIWTFLGEF